jgi:hypothetical protein
LQGRNDAIGEEDGSTNKTQPGTLSFAQPLPDQPPPPISAGPAIMNRITERAIVTHLLLSRCQRVLLHHNNNRSPRRIRPQSHILPRFDPSHSMKALLCGVPIAG